MKKEIKNLIAINEIMWYNKPDTKEKLEELPLKIQWTLYKNMKILEPIFQDFNNFRGSLAEQRNKKWFAEESDKCEQIEENGEELLRIKEEYVEDFKKYDDELNTQIKNIVMETTEVDLFKIDEIENFINDLSEDTKLTIEDLEMLEFFTLQD